jgi:GGDEF domain-containing protein
MSHSSASLPPRPRRTAPIAWSVVEPLAAGAQAIAKGWLLALLERTPLEAVETIPAARIAAESPALCAALARALGSDAELARLRPAGDLAALAGRVGALAGASDAAGAVGAVEALRACVWAAALDVLGEPRDAEAVAALAERLAEVAAVLAGTAASAIPARDPHAQDAPRGAPSGEEPAPQEAVAHDAPRQEARAQDPPSHEAPAGDPEPAREPVPPAPAANGAPTPLPPRPVPDDRPHPAGMDDGELWIATLERHIDRCQREGGGLSLLRVELVDADRLVATTSEEERGVPYGRLAQAIRRAIRRQDLVASDHQGRAWVIAPAVGRAGAIALAERIAAGVERGEHWRGAPLAATIGFAIYGEDGHDAATLIERADEAMLAASAAGVRIGEVLPQDDPERPGPRLVS